MYGFSMSRFTLFICLLLALPVQAAPSFTQSKKILTDIYTDNPQTFYCDCRYTQEGKKLTPEWAACGYKPRKNANRASRIEWEHVMPAWVFGHQRMCWQEGGRKNCRNDPVFREMEADMHNLVPAIGEVNGDRSNYGFGMIEGEPRVYGACDMEIDFKARRAEPPEHRRGDIARTYFYMRDRYGIRLSKQETRLLEAWARMDPVDEWERQRNARITRKQGNANPYITDVTVE